MANDERSRLDLHERLTEVLTPDIADTLMELLPPVGWADVATRADVDHNREVIVAMITGVETSLDARITALDARLDSRITELGSELRTEMAQLRGELRTEMAQLSGELRTEMAEQKSAASQRATATDTRFDRIDDRFTIIDARFGAVDDQLASLRRDLEFQPSLISAQLAGQLQRQHLTLLGLFVTTWAAIAGLIALIVVQ